ncbi:MAG TPA: lysophospholipid acyltransferase family protein [Tepidisphaeraceae bacterium]|nr:lysophospholipid acyltransferase family protein [Tepidisphaeraceae bacterium]
MSDVVSEANPNGKRPEDRLPIRILQLVDTLFARVYHDLTVISPQCLPRKGPAILICNHINSIDPVFLQASIHHRLITWMMAQEYMSLTGLGWFFRTIGIIPVARSGRDTGPLRAALRELQAGRIIGIFPEGRIAETDELLPFQTGVALMAIKTGVPVYPAYIEGSQRGRDMMTAMLSRCEATVAYGPPVQFDRHSGTGRAQLEGATAAMRTAILQLRDQTLAHLADRR